MSHRKDAKSQRQSELRAKQADPHFKMRSVSDGSAWRQLRAKQTDAHFKIRSVSDGSAWGWGPTRTKK
jgi:hypothetical protein